MWKHTVADPHGEGAAEPAPWRVGNQSTMVALTSDETWTAVPNSRAQLWNTHMAATPWPRGPQGRQTHLEGQVGQEEEREHGRE